MNDRDGILKRKVFWCLILCRQIPALSNVSELFFISKEIVSFDIKTLCHVCDRCANSCQLTLCFFMNQRGFSKLCLWILWLFRRQPCHKGICSEMRCLRTSKMIFKISKSRNRRLLWTTWKSAVPAFRNSWKSLRRRTQRISEHIPCGRASERHPIYLRRVIKRIVTMNSVHYRGILKCMKVLWGAAWER